MANSTGGGGFWGKWRFSPFWPKRGGGGGGGGGGDFGPQKCVRSGVAVSARNRAIYTVFNSANFFQNSLPPNFDKILQILSKYPRPPPTSTLSTLQSAVVGSSGMGVPVRALRRINPFTSDSTDFLVGSSTSKSPEKQKATPRGRWGLLSRLDRRQHVRRGAAVQRYVKWGRNDSLGACNVTKRQSQLRRIGSKGRPRYCELNLWCPKGRECCASLTLGQQGWERNS